MTRDTDAVLINDEIRPEGRKIGVGEAKSSEADDESCADIGCAARNINTRDRIERDIARGIRKRMAGFALNQEPADLITTSHKATLRLRGDSSAFCMFLFVQ